MLPQSCESRQCVHSKFETTVKITLKTPAVLAPMYVKDQTAPPEKCGTFSVEGDRIIIVPAYSRADNNGFQ